MLALGHGEDINVKISLKNIDFNAEMNWFPYIFLCWTCRQNWQKQNTDSYYSIVSITFPLSLLFFSHILFSYLIIKPWNKRVLMESKNVFDFHFFTWSMYLEASFHLCSDQRVAICYVSLGYPLVYTPPPLHPISFFLTFPPHHSPITNIHQVCMLLIQR